MTTLMKLEVDEVTGKRRKEKILINNNGDRNRYNNEKQY